MKRLFFLFVFIFIGLGAFGQMDSLLLFKHNDSLQHTYSDSLSKRYDKKFEQLMYTNLYKEKWYLVEDMYLRGSIGWDYMQLQDQFHAPFVYSGHGSNLPLAFGGTDEKRHAEFQMQFQLINLRPSNQYQKEVVQNFIDIDQSWWFALDISFNLAQRIAKSPHYMGLNFLFAYENYDFTRDNKVGYSAAPTSLRLLYLYDGKIQNIRFRSIAMLPILASQNHLRKKVKKAFNPTIRIELFPDFINKKDYHNSVGLFYKLDYLNYVYKDFDYRHRQITHSAGIVYLISY